MKLIEPEPSESYESKSASHAASDAGSPSVATSPRNSRRSKEPSPSESAASKSRSSLASDLPIDDCNRTFCASMSAAARASSATTAAAAARAAAAAAAADVGDLSACSRASDSMVSEDSSCSTCKPAIRSASSIHDVSVLTDRHWL